MNAPTKPLRGLPVPAAVMTSREFNQHTSRAKKAADRGPVVITDRGEPAYVLLSNAQYERLGTASLNILDLLSDPRAEADFDFEFERVRGGPRPIDLSDD